MKTYRSYAILLAIFCFCGGFSLNTHPASAHMGMHDTGEAKVIAKLTTEPERLTAGSPATVRFSLNDAAGKPLQGLTLMHERYVHVVIVSQDFSVFAHIHPRDFEELTPEVLKGGRFFVRFTFPKAGRYVVGIDFAVKGHPYGRHFVVNVAGQPAMATPKKDFFRESKSGFELCFQQKRETGHRPRTLARGADASCHRIGRFEILPACPRRGDGHGPSQSS
jgi:hypothetical protein